MGRTSPVPYSAHSSRRPRSRADIAPALIMSSTSHASVRSRTIDDWQSTTLVRAQSLFSTVALRRSEETPLAFSGDRLPQRAASSTPTSTALQWSTQNMFKPHSLTKARGTQMDEPKQFLATDPDLYEHFMGRWSIGWPIPFLEFAAIPQGQRVLDVGCGTGVITLALARRGCAAVGTDASKSYLDGARRLRSHEAVAYEQADARNVPYPTAFFDACVSTLAIDVVPEPEKVAAEMRRITRPGGIVACGTVDFWGGTSATELVLDTGATIDDGLRAIRDYLRSRPLVWRNGQAQLWQKIGLIDVAEVPIVISYRLSDVRGRLDELRDRSQPSRTARARNAGGKARRDSPPR